MKQYGTGREIPGQSYYGGKMDIYQLAVKYFSDLEVISRWPEIMDGFRRKAIRKPRGWALPQTACEAVGGSMEESIPAVVAIGCMQIAIILIDDMLDADPRGDHNTIGSAACANLASVYQAAGMQAIAECDADEEIKLATQASLNRMMLMTALGQVMDVQNPQDEESYWNMVKTKSSPFYASALQVGALFGNAKPDTAEIIKQFGESYGELIQIHDDLGDTMSTPAGPDWVQGRYPLPLLFAQVVDHPDRERLSELRQRVEKPAALEEAQAILIRSGAISYCLDQLVQRYQVLKEKRASMDVVDPSGLDYLLYEVVHPVNELIKAIGAEIPEELEDAVAM
jgi:geranylgeranyl pyrophosphate synthase